VFVQGLAFARLCFVLPANTYSGVTIDWQITMEQLMTGIPCYPAELIAAKFHNT